MNAKGGSGDEPVYFLDANLAGVFVLKGATRLKSAGGDGENDRAENRQVFAVKMAVDKHATLIERTPGSRHQPGTMRTIYEHSF